MKMNENSKNTQAWLWLTIPIAALAAIAAGSGLFVDGLYSASNTFVMASAIGQDLITLVVALPALIISAILTRRESRRARLIWLGVLVYLVYSYAVTSFTVSFNALFLVYVALLGCSVYALIGGLVTTDLAGIKTRFTEKTPLKAVSIFWGLIAVLFYLEWLGEIIPAQMAGDLPRMVEYTGTPTNAFYVLDIALLLPAVGLTAIWLWRKRAIGYTLAGVLLTALLIMGPALMSEMAFGVQYGLHGFTGEIAIYGIVSVISLGLLIWFLRGLRES